MLRKTSISKLFQFVGTRIRALRNSKAMRQDFLATRVGLSRTSVTNIEKGRQKILLDQLYAFAQALEVEPTSLLPSMEELMNTGRGASTIQGSSMSEKELTWVKSVIGQKSLSKGVTHAESR